MSAPATMQALAEDYLGERRQLGFELRSPGYALMQFARHIDGLGHRGPLTIEIMSDWAQQDRAQRGRRVTWARRLKLLRPFARYLQQFDPDTEVPDDTIFGPTHQRLAPHIYTEQEIVDLLAAARGLAPCKGLRPATYETLFGLIAAAGLRVSEALHLLDSDIDLNLGIVTVRQTKFCKSRQLPLHPSATEALIRYRRIRSRHLAVADDMPFFVSKNGKALRLRTVHRVFANLRQQLGWGARGGHPQPRIHDLRHTFVVRRVMLWHDRGVDIDQAVLALSTYMGHAKVTNTYWYLSGVPDLMAVAARRFEQFAQTREVSHA